MDTFSHQQLFLCDADTSEKYDLTVIAQFRAMIIIIVVGIALCVAAIQIAYATSFAAIMYIMPLLFFAALVSVMLFYHRKLSALLKNSFSKLGDGEIDEIKKQLHTAYIRSQRAGNIMFGTVNGAGVLLGAGTGIADYCLNGGMLWKQVLAAAVCFLLCSAIISFIIWGFMYGKYLRRVRPLEERLKKCEETPIEENI